jgi:hypothetical protein
VRVLGYPFLPDEHIVVPPDPVGAPSTFKRLVFFGRLETRKGFEMFCDTLLMLKADSQTAPLHGIEEIVFLGKEGNQRFETARAAADLLEKGLSIPVRLRTTSDSYQARQYLAEHITDTLVTMPSLIDNFPFDVIEASLIPGLNLICSNQGGQPEILGPQGHDQTFAPTVSAGP